MTAPPKPKDLTLRHDHEEDKRRLSAWVDYQLNSQVEPEWEKYLDSGAGLPFVKLTITPEPPAMPDKPRRGRPPKKPSERFRNQKEKPRNKGVKRRNKVQKLLVSEVAPEEFDAFYPFRVGADVKHEQAHRPKKTKAERNPLLAETGKEAREVWLLLAGSYDGPIGARETAAALIAWRWSHMIEPDDEDKRKAIEADLSEALADTLRRSYPSNFGQP